MLYKLHLLLNSRNIRKKEEVDMEGQKKVVKKSRVIKVGSEESWDYYVTKAFKQGCPVAVHFSASWCTPSRAMSHFFEALSLEHKGVVFLFVDEDETKLELKSYASQVVDGTLDVNQDEIFVQVFGPEKHGRVRGYGAGVTPSELFGSSSKVRDLERHLNESERLQESERQRKVEVQGLKDQIIELENRFEHRFQAMMAEMMFKKS